MPGPATCFVTNPLGGKLEQQVAEEGGREPSWKQLQHQRQLGRGVARVHTPQR